MAGYAAFCASLASLMDTAGTGACAGQQDCCCRVHLCIKLNLQVDPLSLLPQVFPRPVTPAYFASCSPYISGSLAALLHSRLKERGLLDGTDMVAGGCGRQGAGGGQMWWAGWGPIDPCLLLILGCHA